MTSLSLVSDVMADPFIHLCHLVRSEEVLKVSLVCKKWNELTSTPSLLKSKLRELNCKVIDEEHWKTAIEAKKSSLEKLGLAVAGLEPIDYRSSIVEVLRFYADLKKAGTSIEGDQGVTLLTLPQNFTFSLLRKLFPDRFDYVWSHILDTWIDKKIEKAHRVFITNYFLVGSRNQTTEDQQKLCEKARSALTGLKETAALALLTEVVFAGSTLSFCKDPPTWARCAEKTYEGPLVFGGTLSPIGLFYASHYKSMSENLGALAMRVLQQKDVL